MKPGLAEWNRYHLKMSKQAIILVHINSLVNNSKITHGRS